MVILLYACVQVRFLIYFSCLAPEIPGCRKGLIPYSLGGAFYKFKYFMLAKLLFIP